MARKVMLAVAGAGKTYHICHEIDPDKRNLILAFTHENINNIQRELCDAYGSVPPQTTVVTFDSFVYNQMILPYEPSIAEHFGHPTFVSRGITTIDPPPKTKKLASGRVIANPQYITKERLAHYVNLRGRYYCANLSELVLQVKKQRISLINRVAERLNLFYDCVLIDEFQDFREHDYELIMKLAKKLTDVIMVGDYFQHSVSADNNSGKPFKKKSKEISYDEFIDELKKLGFEVDLTTLNKSRRCSEEVCNYISEKLGISINSTSERTGSVIWVDENALDSLDNPEILKLVFNDASKYSFRAMNWSYSKGNTVDAACVILTANMENLSEDDFLSRDFSVSTINKLYVAMTRSRGNLYLMKASVFKKIKHKYINK